MQESLKERVEREKKWHDERFTEDNRHQSTGIFYLALEDWYKDYTNTALEFNRDAKVLELGAGLETIALNNTIKFSLISVDISPKAISYLNDQNLGSNIAFEIEDVHEMAYKDNTFDFILARGVLHHLELHTGVTEINRVLNQRGKILFGEPLAGNPLIRFYRYLTPSLRTPDERPLRNKDIDFIKKSFKNVEVNYYGFVTLIFAILFRKHSLFARKCDEVILNKLKLGKYLAWSCIIKN